MKSETKEKFEDIEFKIVSYEGDQQTFDEFLKDDREIQKEINMKKDEFENRIGRPEQILKTYEINKVILSYLCDNYISWKGAKIVTACLKNGKQTQVFIEHCLNSLGNMANTPLQKHQSFEDIPFKFGESTKDKRILSLVTGAEHPQIQWREMYNIFVAEIKMIKRVYNNKI